MSYLRRRHSRNMPDQAETPVMAGVVDRNIVALSERRLEEERSRGLEARVAGAVMRFAGSMVSVYLHLALFGGWIVFNLGWTPVRPWDESFTVLAMLASVEGIFLSTFVLVSQNRMQAQADERADLDLQVSLLAEHEVTQLITLVTEIAKRMNVEAALDPELDELAQDVAPEKVLDHLEHHAQRIDAE